MCPLTQSLYTKTLTTIPIEVYADDFCHPLCTGPYSTRSILKHHVYRGADKSLARPGRKQTRKHVMDARDSTTSRRELSSFFFLQGKAPKEIHAILTAALACFLPGRAKDLSASLYIKSQS